MIRGVALGPGAVVFVAAGVEVAVAAGVEVEVASGVPVAAASVLVAAGTGVSVAITIGVFVDVGVTVEVSVGPGVGVSTPTRSVATLPEAVYGTPASSTSWSVCHAKLASPTPMAMNCAVATVPLPVAILPGRQDVLVRDQPSGSVVLQHRAGRAGRRKWPLE